MRGREVLVFRGFGASDGVAGNSAACKLDVVRLAAAASLVPLNYPPPKQLIINSFFGGFANPGRKFCEPGRLSWFGIWSRRHSVRWRFYLLDLAEF